MIRPRPASPRLPAIGLLAIAVLTIAVLLIPAPAQARQAEDSGGLSLSDAVILGVVEGITEYLPVSSTGHLLVTQRALGLTDTPAEKDAADAYAIVIQFGAILAVLVLYWRRFWSMLRGLAGRDREGRRLAFALVAAFVPAAVIGFLGEKLIKDYLFHVWPIIAAWIAGGIVILGVVAYDRRKGIAPQDGADLEHLTPGRALVVGLLQCVAMWPGTSRSLVTILGGRLVGLSTVAAVEFSFLLGLVTLTAASGYEVVTDGGMIVDSLGVLMPIVGIVAAFVSAALAVKWMVGYLNKHSMAIFGWYRIVLGIAAGALVLTNVL
jgi:undecaprenyl-diphosphatase